MLYLVEVLIVSPGHDDIVHAAASPVDAQLRVVPMAVALL